MLTYEEVMDEAVSRWQGKVEKGYVISVYFYDEDLALAYLYPPKGKRKVEAFFSLKAENFELNEGLSAAPTNGLPLYWSPCIQQQSSKAPVCLFISHPYGEACVDRMSSYGFIATTSPWGADVTDIGPLAGRDVWIWPSNIDSFIRRDVRAYAKKLRAIGCKVKVLEVSALNLPSRGTFLDWEQLHGEATQEEIEALLVENGL